MGAKKCSDTYEEIDGSPNKIEGVTESGAATQKPYEDCVTSQRFCFVVGKLPKGMA
ncbi:MAG: hypothetical protein Crog4KO_36330 [Crocinitomicaceae bacterium]